MTLAPFLDPLALLIVGGGTLLATLLRHRLADVGRALAALAVLWRRPLDAAPLVEQVAALGRIARRHGVMALDRSVIADADVAAAVALIVDGRPSDEVEADLLYRRRARAERHLAAADVWCGAAEAAPAMGMVGTLVGLVAMFVQMRDPQAIGAAMAIALLATLYGALFANLLLQPIGVRLRRLARVEAFERERIVAPLVALAHGERPRPVSFAPSAPMTSAA